MEIGGTPIRFPRIREKSHFTTSIAFMFRLILLLTLAIGLAGCDKSPDADSEVTVEITPRDELKFPDTDAGKAIASHLDALFAIGPDAEANYQASLQALREKADESITTIVDIYNTADKSLYGERAVLVETLSELRLPQARDPLLLIANEKLPERVALPDDTTSAIDQESIIRMTAIRGLGHIAIQDDEAARELGVLAKHREPSLHEQARQSLAIVITQEKDERRLKWLIEIFPGEYKDWLVLKGLPPPAPAQ